MPQLVILTGPIAAGKNATAGALAQMLTARGRTVVVADVDDIAAMVAKPGAGEAGLWFAAHEAHGALVGQWMRSAVEYVIVVGPIYSTNEQAALMRALPPGVSPLWVVVDAPVTVTLARAQMDPSRGLSRDPDFHQAAHRRFRGLMRELPPHAAFDSSKQSADEIAVAVVSSLGVR